MGRPAQHFGPPSVEHAAPFLKWAGGKGQLLDRLYARRPPRFGAYHEPFIGSGALYFHLRTEHRINGGATISDINPTLMCTYRAVRDDVDELIERLTALEAAHDPWSPGDAYYPARDRFNELAGDTSIERAALMIYLNRTGFNGLYRENSKGLFNVPVGRYAKPRIVNEHGLRSASLALKDAELRQERFDHVLDRAKPGDFVYFDPPYHPLNVTSSFTSYAQDGFTADDQRRLAELFRTLASRGVHCLLSNSTAPLIVDLYEGLAADDPSIVIERVSARRAINSRAESRGEIEELLVRSYALRSS